MYVIMRTDGKMYTDPGYPYTEERCWTLDPSKARVYKSGKKGHRRGEFVNTKLVHVREVLR